MDVTKLDWRRWYRDRSTWPARTELFLAEAVLRMAPLLIYPWDDIIAAGTMAEEQPLLPGSLDAFHPDETPKPEIYSAWAPAILDYVSAAEFTERRLSESDHAAWFASQKYDPASKRMVFDPTKAYTTGNDVSFAHWNYAAGVAAEINELRRAGMIAMPLLARAITELAKDERIRTIARPIGGGDTVDLKGSHWLIDDATPRIASCGINMDAPTDIDAEPTHLIFVDSDGFDAHAALYARRHMISLLEEGITPADAGFTGPKGRALYPPLVKSALRLMQEHMKVHPTRYQRSVLREVVESGLGVVSDGVFEEARRRLIPEYPHIKDGGAPPGTNRKRPKPTLSVVQGGRSEPPS